MILLTFPMVPQNRRELLGYLIYGACFTPGFLDNKKKKTTEAQVKALSFVQFNLPSGKVFAKSIDEQ